MTYPDIRAALARERQDTLLAEARAARLGAPIWLSFPRIIDIPYEICIATLESWPRLGRDSELRIGPSRLRWPIEDERDDGMRRIEVGVDRGRLRAPRRMSMEISRWSRWPAERQPCTR